MPPYFDVKESLEGDVSRQDNKDQKDISRDVNAPQSRSGVEEDQFLINLDIEHINSRSSNRGNEGRKLSEKRAKRPSETGNISVEQLQLGLVGEG